MVHEKTMVVKLVVCIMGQDCEKFIGMALESVKDADVIVYCDGGSTDKTLNYLEKEGFNRADTFTEEERIIGISTHRIIEQHYDQEDPKMNGTQRNFYLDYLKENFPDHWVLCIDADEVVENLDKIKELIQDNEGIYSVKMRHLISDLAHEDSTVPNHFVLHRLFKISDAGEYPLVEHPVLQPKNKDVPIGSTNCTTIWHLAYCPNMWSIKKRYENHMKKSKMHTPEYLKSWYFAHLFGNYPNTAFNPVELPKVILDEFGIDKDELYFAGRKQMEAKHYQDAIDWIKYFEILYNEPLSVLLFGCGFGQRVYALRSICEAYGVEISNYAVKNSIIPKYVSQGNILDFNESIGNFKLTVAYDILEHLKYEDLEKAINTLITFSDKNILISVPMLGDPNLEADPTHIIKESRDWWVEKFVSKGLKEVEVPEHFLFKEQLLIFEK